MKMKFIFLLLISISLSCKSEKNEMKNLSEVFELNENQNLMNELKADNDSVSFGWTYGYNLTGKKKEINIKLYNSKKLSSTERKAKLKNDSETINTKLEHNLTDLSYYDKLNYYLIFNGDKIDSLRINISDLKK
jgi:hypothetical protein